MDGGHPVNGLTVEQISTLMEPIRPTRVAKRSQSGRQLSYLEAYDVKAHMIRVFGFGAFDSELLQYGHIATRDYQSQEGKDMVEVIYHARVQVTVRDGEGDYVCRYTEAACGSASGPASMLGEHHDNALKTAESDAFKRCCVYLGSQFGLSLYDQGSQSEVVRKLVTDPRPKKPVEDLTPEQQANLEHTLGATEVKEPEPVQT